MNWPDDIDELTSLLQKDGLLLLPTDTVWGLCCNALSPTAIHRILKLKQQEPGQGLVILVADMAMLKAYVHDLHPRLETLLALHRRPMTVLYDKVKDLPEILAGPDSTYAIRIVTDPFISDLIQAFGKPIVATIPQWKDEPIPSHFGMISSQFIEHVDYVAKWKRYDKQEGTVSVMVSFTPQHELVFLRN